MIGHEPDVFAYSDKAETFNDELGLPRSVELFTSQLFVQKVCPELPKSRIQG